MHFEPEAHSDDYNAKFSKQKNPSDQYRQDIARGVGGHESSNHDPNKKVGLPLYVIPGSSEAARIIAEDGLVEYDEFEDDETEDEMSPTGWTLAHSYAAEGKLDELVEVIEGEEDLLTAADENGWTPLHEGARSGNVDVVRYLLSKGADVNHRTGDDESGASALALAHEAHGPDHPISKFIESVGGILLMDEEL